MTLRSPRFLHRMTRLALAAVLLLALAPTVSRWVESSGQRLPDALVAMCTSAGLGFFKPASDLQSPVKPAPMPSGEVQGDACDYCPLLAQLAPLLLAFIVLLPLRAAPLRIAPSVPPQRDAFLPSGLGARGPPILL